MFTTFNLTSLFLGINLAVPLVLGCLLLSASFVREDNQIKAQNVTGILYILAALYAIVRIVLLVNNDIGSEFERAVYYVVDSAVITIFGLVPYTIIFEEYPKWWHYLLALSPLILIPIMYVTHLLSIAMWSHMLPILVGSSALFYLGKNARRIDLQLPDYFANPELHAKSWVIYISIGYLLITCLSMMRYIIPGNTVYNIAINLSWCIIMFLLYIFLVRQKSAENTLPTKPNSTFSVKNTGGGINQVYESIRLALEEKCIKEQLYLNRDLNLNALARACGTNRTYLTTYLHEQQHQTFYEYINTLRLAHVDKLLANIRLSQESIALKCGFNSAQTMRNVYLKIRGKELTRLKE